MQNLRNRVLNALKFDNTENILNDISQSQDNLIKNYSKPVLNNKNRSHIIEKYHELQNVGKSLNRYNALKKNNYQTDAEEQKNDIENVVLKGGVCNIKYIWHSENGEYTCNECRNLDGQVFDFYDELPDHPHPNCKCYVEIVENDDINSPNEEEENEQCNAIEEIDNLLAYMEEVVQETYNISDVVKVDVQELNNLLTKIQNLINEADFTLKGLQAEYGKHLSNCENNIDKYYEDLCNRREVWQNLLHDILGILNPVNAFLNTIRIFLSNYLELLYSAYILKDKEKDKYYHSKANCEATQEMGIIGEKSATLLSNLKEEYDKYTYVHTHKVTIEEAIADSERDQIANRLGRYRGRKYPNCKCSELMQDLLPNSEKLY